MSNTRHALHLVLRTPARNRVSSRPRPQGCHLVLRSDMPLLPHNTPIRMNSTNAKPTSAAFDPLNPQIATDDLGIPLEPIPLPAEILNPPPKRITSAQLQRLHKMAAIAPPAVGSEEEVEMLRGLEGLLGLMEQVKMVELDHELLDGAQGPDDTAEAHKQVRKEAIRKLLVSGNYADPSDIFDGSRIEEELPEQDELPGHEAVVGKDLLAWQPEPMKR